MYWNGDSAQRPSTSRLESGAIPCFSTRRCCALPPYTRDGFPADRLSSVCLARTRTIAFLERHPSTQLRVHSTRPSGLPELKYTCTALNENLKDGTAMVRGTMALSCPGRDYLRTCSGGLHKDTIDNGIFCLLSAFLLAQHLTQQPVTSPIQGRIARSRDRSVASHHHHKGRRGGHPGISRRAKSIRDLRAPERHGVGALSCLVSPTLSQLPFLALHTLQLRAG